MNLSALHWLFFIGGFFVRQSFGFYVCPLCATPCFFATPVPTNPCERPICPSNPIENGMTGQNSYLSFSGQLVISFSHGIFSLPMLSNGGGFEFIGFLGGVAYPFLSFSPSPFLLFIISAVNRSMKIKQLSFCTVPRLNFVSLHPPTFSKTHFNSSIILYFFDMIH